MKKLLISCLLLITLLAFGGCGSDKKSDTTKKVKSSVTATSVTKTSEEKKDAGTYENRTLTVPDGVVKITGFQKGVDYDGKPMFYVLFDLTNNTKEAKNIQIMYNGFVSATQNTGSTTEDLQYAVTTDSPLQSKLELLRKDINPGATVQGAYAYEFADPAKPVIFTFKDTLISGKDPIATEEITIQ